MRSHLLISYPHRRTGVLGYESLRGFDIPLFDKRRASFSRHRVESRNPTIIMGAQTFEIASSGCGNQLGMERSFLACLEATKAVRMMISCNALTTID
jgi:hypothetical protein